MVKRSIYVILFSLLLAETIHASEYQEVIVELPTTEFERLNSVRIKTRFWGAESAVNRDRIDDVTASDYGCHLMQIHGEGFRLYSGGTWKDPSQSPIWDGLHVLLYKALNPLDGNGGWAQPDERPEFLLGAEEGASDTWYSGEAGDPEVLLVDGVWYMYTQVKIPAGMPLDKNSTNDTQKYASIDVSRIMLFTSEDGHNWMRMNDRGVIKNIDNPTTTAFINPEVIYVPWDHYGDGKNWWLYVSATVKGGAVQTYRIRSANPKTFFWNNKVSISLPGGLGGQVSYIENAPSGPLFIRINYIKGTQPANIGRLVPTVCFSRDGRYWYWSTSGSGCELAGSDDAVNKDCLYPGISTINGQGQLPLGTDSNYHAVYGTSTASGSSSTDLAGNSEIGYGDILFDMNPLGPHTWYVKKGGSGNGKGWESAFGTICDAVTAASNEDEIWVASGTYTETIDINSSISILGGFAGTETSSGQSSWGNNPTQIIPAYSDHNPAGAIHIVSDGTRLDGLALWGGGENHGMVGIYYDSITSATLSSCTIVGGFISGVSTTYSSVTLDDCYLAGLQGDGQVCQLSSVTLSNCQIFSNLGRGISCDSSSLLLRNCNIHDNSANANAALYSQDSAPILINCTIVGNTSVSGAAVSSATSNLTLTNCILWNAGDELEVVGTAPVVNYCDIEGGYPGTGNNSADPLFVNTVNADYHIQGHSPCIGKGLGPGLDPLVLPYDIDNDPRSGATCDIGCDEYDGPARVRDWAEY